MTHALLINSSARIQGSVTRELTSKIIAHLGPDKVTNRDLAMPLPQIDAQWIAASSADPSTLDDADKAALSLSDELIGEVVAADVIVIGAPLYNFSVPASLKLWIDQIARLGKTFELTGNETYGLLDDTPVIIAIATGGIEIGSDGDFATGFLKYVLGFVGLKDVTFIVADLLNDDMEGAIKRAETNIAKLALAA